MHRQAGIFVLVTAGLAAVAPQAHAGLAIQQSVDTDVLTVGAVAEFVVTVRNAGEEAVDIGEVHLGFSTGLVEPAGTAPFYSQGSFDPAEGLWALGTLLPGASAVLTLPAQVTADPLPPCVFSRARLESSPAGADWAGALAFATLRRPGVEHCVNLVVEEPWAYRMWCDAEVTLESLVSNLGPDPAPQVQVAVSQQPKVLPGLAFKWPCTGSQECLLDSLGAGESARMWLDSSPLKNRREQTVTVDVTASSAGTQLETGLDSARRTLVIAPFEECDFGDFAPGGSVGCFIATAAYGSALHPHVMTLRRFRDRFLLTHAPGRALVALYYRASPRMADYIAGRPAARAVTRALLWPLVLAVQRPLHAAAGALLSLLLLLHGRRRSQRPALPTLAPRGASHENNP